MIYDYDDIVREISRETEIAPGVYLTDRKPRGAICRELSRRFSGIWRVTSYSYSNQRGNQPSEYWIHSSEIQSVEAARTVAANLIDGNPGYTYPKMARQICEYLDLRQPAVKRVLEIVPPGWHYQHAETIEGYYAYLYDLTSAYWQIVARCESPIFTIADRAIIWRPLYREQQRRWDQVRDAFASGAAKKLRLALVGVNAAGWNRDGLRDTSSINAFCRGEPYIERPCSAGLQAVAIMAVRCIYEVTQLQAEKSSAIYSNADCVISTDRGVDVWQSLGLQFRLVAEGPTAINSIGAYRVGERQTELFHLNSRYIESKRARAIETIWYDRILKAS